MSIEAMKLALAALETCRIRSVSEWSVEDITPKNVTAAIAALRTAIQQAEAQQPATGEPVGEPFGWWFTEDPDVFCMPGSGFRRFPNKPEHTVECLALYTRPAPSVPDGYVLVPVEPTPEMEKAFRQAFTDQLHKRRNQWGRAKHTMSAEAAGLRAMLTASPHPQQPKEPS